MAVGDKLTSQIGNYNANKRATTQPQENNSASPLSTQGQFRNALQRNQQAGRTREPSKTEKILSAVQKKFHSLSNGAIRWSWTSIPSTMGLSFLLMPVYFVAKYIGGWSLLAPFGKFTSTFIPVGKKGGEVIEKIIVGIVGGILTMVGCAGVAIIAMTLFTIFFPGTVALEAVSKTFQSLWSGFWKLFK